MDWIDNRRRQYSDAMRTSRTSSAYPKDTADDVASGLRNNGWQVVDRGDFYATSTAICHGGDNAAQLLFKDARNGGVFVKCGTQGCDAWQPLLEAAGLWKRSGTPAQIHDSVAAMFPDAPAHLLRGWRLSKSGKSIWRNKVDGDVDSGALIIWPTDAGCTIKDTNTGKTVNHADAVFVLRMVRDSQPDPVARFGRRVSRG